MKAWSRAQANQEREANLYHHHQVGSLELCSCLFTSSTIDDGVLDQSEVVTESVLSCNSVSSATTRDKFKVSEGHLLRAS